MLIIATGGWLPETSMSLPMRVLTAVGITAAGALGSGVLVQLLSKMLTREKVPRPALNLVRVAGAAAAGLASVLWLFGTGSGFGTAGKGGGGGDNDKGKEAVFSGENGDKKKAGEDSEKTDSPPPAGGNSLEIEVLGNRTVRRLADQKAVDEDRRFRVATEGKSKLLTLDEVVEVIAQQSRMGHTPDWVYVKSYLAETRPQDRAMTLDRLGELAKELGKDKVNGGWVRRRETQEEPK